MKYIFFTGRKKNLNLWSDNALRGMHTHAAPAAAPAVAPVAATAAAPAAAPAAAAASDAAIAAVHNLFAAF